MSLGVLNGINVEELRDYVASATQDPMVADRDLVVVGRWVGAERAEVTFPSGEASAFMGGENEPSAMKMLLACLAACDIDLVVNRASLLGVEIKSLTVEATGHFNVQRYLGVTSAPGSGYDRIAYTVRLEAPGATREQLAELQHACEHASPVADTLRQSVGLTLEFNQS